MASLHFAYQLKELLSGRGSTDASDQHKPAPQQTTVREDQTTVTKDQPGQSPPPINLSLPLDDELLVAMRRTLPELYNATCRLSRANRDAQKLRDAQKAAWTDADTEREISRGMDRGLARGLSVTPQLVRLIDKLKAVPITKRKEEILNLVRANTYTIVVAATGTGKSTQLPQIFLNDSMMNGSRTACRVICVQPRRVAASSLARRVAHERMEKLGDSVGYHVRFNARLPNTRNNITYCTTGIVLQLLQHVPGYLDSISHIVLDEVHERDTDLDMLMLLLRSYVNERLAKGAHVPKIIMTSATIDVDLFASYFQNRLPGGSHAPAPHVSIPGRTFKVSRYFLHDVLDSLPRVHDSSTVDMLLKEASTQTYLKRFRPPSDGPARSEGEVAQRQPAEDSGELASPESFQPAYHDNDPLVPLGLICAAIFNVLRTSTNGAILVFLPGMRDILNVEAALCDFGVKLGFDFSAESKFSILKLHSSLPEGHAAPFESVQHGCRRIILATTIAETSVTIPDVKFVIDTGKSRQNRFYPETRSSELAYDWVSKSCVAQRAGRAGRTQSGEYFALFPKDKYESFRVTRAPEMSRCDLASLSLRVKYALPQTRIEDAFRLALEPPVDFRVSCSVETLKHMGALDQNEELTALGRHLLKLPVRPALGKLIYLGVLFRCLDPVLIIAALGDELSLFRMQHEDELRAETSRLRKEYAEASKSDHITTINTFRKLREVYHREGRAQAMEFAYSQHIRYSRFQDALRGGTQLLQILYDNRFIRRSESAGNDLQFGGAALNENSKNISLVKALLLHANSLNIAAPIPKASDKAYLTDGTREGLVASSVNAAKPPRALLVYDSKKPLTSTMYGFVNTTVVTPLAACLFGGPLEVQDNHVCVDTWLKMPIQNPSLNEGDYSIKLLVEMRKALDMVCVVIYGIDSILTSAGSQYLCRIFSAVGRRIGPVYGASCSPCRNTLQDGRACPRPGIC